MPATTTRLRDTAETLTTTCLFSTGRSGSAIKSLTAADSSSGLINATVKQSTMAQTLSGLRTFSQLRVSSGMVTVLTVRLYFPEQLSLNTTQILRNDITISVSILEKEKLSKPRVLRQVSSSRRLQAGHTGES